MPNLAAPEPIELVQGDVDDRRVLTVTGFADLSWVSSVVARIGPADIGADAVELTASVADAVACTIEVNFGIAAGWLPATATPGSYLLDAVLTSAGGRSLTAPVKREQMVPVVVRSRRT